MLPVSFIGDNFATYLSMQAELIRLAYADEQTNEAFLSKWAFSKTETKYKLGLSVCFSGDFISNNRKNKKHCRALRQFSNSGLKLYLNLQI